MYMEWLKKRLHFNILQRPTDRDQYNRLIQNNTTSLGLPNMFYYLLTFNSRHLAHWSLPPERVPTCFFCSKQYSSQVGLIIGTHNQHIQYIPKEGATTYPDTVRYQWHSCVSTWLIVCLLSSHSADLSKQY